METRPVQTTTDKPSSSTLSQAQAPETSQQPDQLLRDKLILIADDAADNRLLLEMILRRAGARTALAHDGIDAIDKTLHLHPDAVIMDVQMPHLDGYSASKRLRDLGFKGTIISCTARGLREDMNKSKHSGCDAHLTKPLRRNDLLRLLDEIWAQTTESHH